MTSFVALNEQVISLKQILITLWSHPYLQLDQGTAEFSIYVSSTCAGKLKCLTHTYSYKHERLRLAEESVVFRCSRTLFATFVYLLFNFSWSCGLGPFWVIDFQFFRISKWDSSNDILQWSQSGATNLNIISNHQPLNHISKHCASNFREMPPLYIVRKKTAEGWTLTLPQTETGFDKIQGIFIRA